jgi:UPF0716 protein FxsA
VFFRLLLLFTMVPLVELLLLLELSRHVGFLPTFALVLFTGALGAWLTRSQGMAVFGRVRLEFVAGRLPTDALLDGMLVLIAGAVLLTPGLLTDIAGFSLLWPPGRQFIRQRVARWFRSKMELGKGVVVIESDRFTAV